MLDRYTYEVGDVVDIFGCGDDNFGSTEGTMIYVDKEYAIAHIPCASPYYAFGLNLDHREECSPMSHDKVAAIIGDMSQYGKHDVFLNYYNNSETAYSFTRFHQHNIIGKKGDDICYTMVDDEDYYIAPCGGQTIYQVSIAKIYGDPADGQNIFPVNETELKERNLSPDGNYYWITLLLTKQYGLEDWIEITELDEMDNVTLAINGDIVYSLHNIAVIKSYYPSCLINSEPTRRIKQITYQELSEKPGFVPFFKTSQDNAYFEIDQVTGETTEMRMPYEKIINDMPLHGVIWGYLYKNDKIVSRLVAIEKEKYPELNSNNCANPANEKEKSRKEYSDRLIQAFSKFEFGVLSTLICDIDLSCQDICEKFYCIPLEPGEKVYVIH